MTNFNDSFAFLTRKPMCFNFLQTYLGRGMCLYINVCVFVFLLKYVKNHFMDYSLIFRAIIGCASTTDELLTSS